MRQTKRGVFKKYKVILIPIIVLVIAEILFQVFYPSNKMLPVAWIDGVNVSNWERQDVVDELNSKYNSADIEIYFGNNTRPTFIIKPSTLGVQIGNADRVNDSSYKWYLRLVPSSILWAGLLPPSIEPTIKRDSVSIRNFVAQNLGDSCDIKPVNATLKVENDSLKVIKMLSGGTCKIDDIKDALNSVKYKTEKSTIKISMEEFDADVTDDDARNLAMAIGTKLQRDILMTTDNGEKFFIPSAEIMSWLEFSVANGELAISINKNRSGEYYAGQIAPQVKTDAGVTVITTNNLTDLIRENGSEGKVLNVDETNLRLIEFLMDERQTISLALDTIYPSIEYSSRFESNSNGLAALIKYYTQTHSGSYGVMLQEIGGQGRSVAYNSDQKFNVSGAARMVLAYTMLDRIEQGLTVTEEDVDSCIEDVLKDFQTSCVDPLVFGNFEKDIAWLGLYNTTINNDNIISTANDLGKFLLRLHDRRLNLESSNNQVIYNGLKSAVPRQGISSAIGIGNLDATGGSNESLSDAAVVFTADTNYLLIILTKDSSWQNIAELTSQIQGLMSK